MNNAVFGKTMETVQKNREIKLVITDRRRNYLESESNYHTTKFFTENCVGYRNYKNSNTHELTYLFRTVSTRTE